MIDLPEENSEGGLAPKPPIWKVFFWVTLVLVALGAIMARVSFFVLNPHFYEDTNVAVQPDPRSPRPSTAPTTETFAEYNPITFSSVSTPTKKINNIHFAFTNLPENAGDYYHQLQVVRDDNTLEPANKSTLLSEPHQAFANILGSYISDRTTDFWIDFEHLKFFIVDSKPESNDSSTTIFEVSFSPSEPEPELNNKRILLFKQRTPFIYGNTSILFYDPDSKTLVLSSGGGDGCGSEGNISKVDTESGVSTNVIDVGTGCGKGPAFGGIYKNGKDIIIGERQQIEGEWTGEDTLTSIYLLNPITLEKTIVINEQPTLSGYFIIDNSAAPSLEILSHDNEILLGKYDSGTEFFTLNVETKQLEPIQ